MNHHILNHLALARESGIIAEVFSLLKHFQLIFSLWIQAVKPLFDMDMATGAGTVTAAVMIDADIVVESGVKKNRTLLDFDLDSQRLKHHFWHRRKGHNVPNKNQVYIRDVSP